MQVASVNFSKIALIKEIGAVHESTGWLTSSQFLDVCYFYLFVTQIYTRILKYTKIPFV